MGEHRSPLPFPVDAHRLRGDVPPMTTCTVITSAVTGACGRAAVWTDGTFAECADHAADIGAMARTQARTVGEHTVGDTVVVSRYGKTFHATVVRVGARGAAYAEFTYGNGAKRTVRV